MDTQVSIRLHKYEKIKDKDILLDVLVFSTSVHNGLDPSTTENTWYSLLFVVKNDAACICHFRSVRKLGGIYWIARECVGTGIGHGEVHFCSLGGSKILVGTGILHSIEGIPEHLIVCFFPV